MTAINNYKKIFGALLGAFARAKYSNTSPMSEYNFYAYQNLERQNGNDLKNPYEIMEDLIHKFDRERIKEFQNGHVVLMEMRELLQKIKDYGRYTNETDSFGQKCHLNAVTNLKFAFQQIKELEENSIKKNSGLTFDMGLKLEKIDKELSELWDKYKAYKNNVLDKDIIGMDGRSKLK